MSDQAASDPAVPVAGHASGPVAGPVQPGQRVAILDVLRGAALFGVLIANIDVSFSIRGYLPQSPDSGTLDALATRAVHVLVSGKSITLLSCMFGLGFAMQLMRAEGRAQDPLRPFVRRSLALLVIGLCHSSFLWWGDITADYALLSFTLLLFRRARDRTLLIAGLLFAFLPRMIVAIPAIGDGLRAAMPHPADHDAFNAELVAAIQGTDYPALMSAHLRQLGYHLSSIIGWYVLWVIGRLLLGYWAGRRGLFERDGADHLPLFRKLLAAGLALAAASSLWEVATVALYRPGPIPTYVRVPSTALHEAAWLGQAFAYAAALVLLLQRPRWRPWLLILAPVGRMPLTVYLSQSLAATFVFYGWGLGLGGELGGAACLAIAFAIFTLQIIGCHLWLRRFRFGPAEWLWRLLTYGRAPAMR